jgi:hypothetical protein
MKAVWAPHPLTTEERANVVAFLAQAGLSQRPAEAVWQLAGLTVLGVVVLFAIAGFTWRNRLKFGVRRPMMARPTTGHTGPYHGGSIGLSLGRNIEAGETQGVEVRIAQRLLDGRMS